MDSKPIGPKSDMVLTVFGPLELKHYPILFSEMKTLQRFNTTNDYLKVYPLRTDRNGNHFRGK